MSKALDELRRLDAEYEKTADAYELDLRLDLAFLVIRGMASRGWNMKTLAAKTGYTEAYISNVVHANSRCGFEAAGKILHALGIRAEMVQRKANTVAEPDAEKS